MKTRVLVFAGALVCCGAMACGTAWARTMQQKLDEACAADIARLCAGAKPDPDKIKACMLTKRPQVSSTCMALIDASE